ncbi:hypothetical protein AGOR_G00247120 [Albula goreensis]|uniref:B30.2/SPRY domain-containing protein n=1 Tax=Albula goreensis TaxID=1534307 RepID=A0A8T3CDH2_9TELE|nr:hypothetical protein AGOR_G00247120 [Albula goreensis]
MDEISKKMEDLLITVTAIEQEMGRADVLFLQNFNATMKRAQRTVEVPDVSEVLIDVAKHLGNLKFQVWEKMLGMVQYTPVILDPNSASPSLLLSEDLTSVQEVKNREPYESEWPILGSQGFSSGKHQWDVEINRDTIIDIGITKEPPELRSTLNNISSKCCYERLTGSCGGLPKKSELQGKNKIRVLLDCDQNIVSFFDIYGKETLSTKKYTFTGKVFPFFNLLYLPPEPLKMVPAKVKVTVQ